MGILLGVLMALTFLVELDTAVRLKGLTSQTITCDSVTITCDQTDVFCDGKAGVVTKTLSVEVARVEGVQEDGTALTEGSSTTDVDQNPAKWFYTVSSRELRINLTGGIAFSSQVVVALILEPLAHGRTLIKDRNSMPLAWEGRVLALPVVAQALTPDELGGGSIATLGSLTLQNEDGRYDRLIGERIFSGWEARIYRGQDTDAYSAFTLWAKGLMEQPVAGREILDIPLVNLGRKLDGPAITTIFTTTSYPNADANILGLNIPKIWGTVKQVEAFRIASGRWKVASHAVTSIDAAYDSDGAAVTITATDLPNGEFTVGAAHDTKDRLWVDCRGKAKDKPGELIRDVAEDFGIATADIDTTALATLDTDRNVSLGFQVRTGSVREVLNLIAESAFVDWWVTRTNVLSGRARKRDQGNLVTNGTFETDTSGWTVGDGATLSRNTATKFRGNASGEIAKGANGSGRAEVTNLALKANTRYTATLLAALKSGSPATGAFRIAVTDSDGNEFASADVTLSATAWTRVMLTTRDLTSDTVDCSSTAVTCDSEVYTCAAEAGGLRVYPQFGGADAVIALIDEVELVKTVLLDDTNAAFADALVHAPMIWRARAGYNYLYRTDTRRFAQQSDSAIRRLFPTAESRQTNGHLLASADADTVAQAILDYYGVGRLRLRQTLFAPEAELVQIGDVVDVQTSRLPTLPASGRLFRIASFAERIGQAELPVLEVEAEVLYDPVFDSTAITA